MEKIKKIVNPVYNEAEQVKRCAYDNEKMVEARVAIVIGHNCRNLVSSTDWRLKTDKGNTRVFMFSIHPQYPNFIECVAGASYQVSETGRFSINWDEVGAEKKACVILDGKKYFFNPGEALKIYIEPESVFVATDCLVKCEENDEMRIYTVLTDKETGYCYMDKSGRISRHD